MSGPDGVRKCVNSSRTGFRPHCNKVLTFVPSEVSMHYSLPFISVVPFTYTPL
jgi:hypothetical protein